MTHTQSAHWEYTVNEWKSENHQNLLDIIFQDEINIIYDIGANVGGTAYTFLEYAKNKNIKLPKIYCFEPDNDNMNFLKSKFEKEIKDGLIVPIEIGIYYGLKEAKAYGMGYIHENRIHPNVGGMGIEECMKKVEETRRKNGEDVFAGQVDNKVFQLDTLENVAKDFELPDFIKIDIEGAEKNVLENSKIINNAKYLNVEWNQDECIKTFLKNKCSNFKVIYNKADNLLQNTNIDN